ncbi:MAG: diadenylate cyclase [Candidatus Thermoplasmatota archaeon]|nr:diadenylate cyclase [Candidatus Thermoplasmatota archaeon]
MFPVADELFSKDKTYDLSIVVSDNEDFLTTIMEKLQTEKTIVLTSRGKDVNVREGVIYYTYARNLENSIYFMDFIERLIFRIFLGGYISEDMDVLLVSDYPFKFLLEFNSSAMPFYRVMNELSDVVDREVMEALLKIVFEIHLEGREGSHIGALFIVGDTKKVLEESRQLVINPYHNQNDEVRSILNKENWESIKEFAQLDGAFIIDSKGKILSAGRYIMVDPEVQTMGGLGGRHLAAASITYTTSGVSFALSSSGTIRIFKKGKVVLKEDLN